MADTHKEDVTVPDGLLSNLERDFNEAMEALEGEEALGHFRLEYEKLYRSLKKSHESEKHLVSKCQELTQELLTNAAKMQAAVKLSQGDHSTIEALKKEIEKAWRTVDSANDKDIRARETIKSLKQEITALQSMVQEGAAFSSDHTSTLEELKLESKRLFIECEENTRQVDTFTREIADMTNTHKRAEVDLQSNTDEMMRIADRFELVKQEHRRERNACERADFQCRELLMLLRTREREVQGRQAQQLVLENSITDLNTQVHEHYEKKQALLQKLETAEKQLYHTQQSYNDSVDTTADLNERLQQMDRSIHDTKRQIIDQSNEVERILRVKESDFKEYVRLQQYNGTIKQEHDNLLHQKRVIDKRIVTLRNEKASIAEALQLVNKERHILEKRGEKEVEKRGAIEVAIALEVDNHNELEESIKREQDISVRLKNAVSRLEKDREKCVAEVSQINIQHHSAQEELKMAQIATEDTQKAIEESETRLNKQQAKYEHVRSERNQFSKKLIEAQDEIMELKQRFKMMDHQISQFKEELQMKEKRHNEEVSKQKTSKERLTKARKLVNDHTAAFDKAKLKSEAISQQIKQLVKVINMCDKELSAQQQDFLKVSNERDLLGTQLIRRNDELALLYDKLRVQQEILNNSEAAYRARVEDIRLLNLKTAEVRRQANLAVVRSKNIEDMKAHIRKLEAELAAQQAMAAALSEELENPQNTSRWRNVEGQDPTSEELEKKITELQKRLITKSEESLEHELLLQEKARLVIELQTILARQPGPEVAQQLNVYHKDLQKKNARMKQKASELNMTSTHISELKYEAERLRRELHDMKRKYYEMKMKNDLLLAPPAAATNA